MLRNKYTTRIVIIKLNMLENQQMELYKERMIYSQIKKIDRKSIINCKLFFSNIITFWGVYLYTLGKVKQKTKEQIVITNL